MASIFRRALGVARTRMALARQRAELSPRLGTVDFGDLARLAPISRTFGLDRGTPIDRHYIDLFLKEHSALIRGRVLEVADRHYTERFGGTAVQHSDVLHLTGETPETTIVADLTNAPQIATDSFDCIILTQTLDFIFGLEAAVSELHRILRPGGCVLCTVSGISQISRFDMDRWGDYWRFTSASADTLFRTTFPAEDIEVRAYGNVFAATAFLHGLAAEELPKQVFDTRDDDYQLLVTVKAVKRP